MKDFLYVVEDYIKKHKNGKRALAALVSLSVFVSFAVPMMLTEPAVSQTRDSFAPVGDLLASQMFNAAEDHMIKNMNGGKDGNSGYSKGSLSEVALLIGEGHDWVEEAGCETASDVIEAAKKKYFLGIASDFCVFVEGDFKPTDSDAEGRIAIGGNFIPDTDWGSYQIGAGDYGNNILLHNLSAYRGIKDFAHAIVNGKRFEDAAPYGTYEKGEKMIIKDSGNQDWIANSGYKRFVVSEAFDNENTHHYEKNPNDKTSNDFGAYHNGCKHWGVVSFDELSQFYQSDALLNVKEQMEYIREQSRALERKQGKVAAVDTAAKTITFDAGGGSAKTVYFNLNADEVGDFDGYTFNFINIPTQPGTVISEIDTNAHPDEPTEFDNIANIIVNVKGTDVQIGSKTKTKTDKDNGNAPKLVTTTINGIVVSNKDGDQTWSNNHPYSENILYNFTDYNDGEEREFSLNTNFNGTILAPDANVKSPKEGCGHLSGALIAKSFEGGQEFGYRPYRGSVDILETQMGYVLPFSKVIEGGDKSLAGAKFNIKDENGKTVSSFISKDGNPNYVNFPTEIAFDGSKNYESNSEELNKAEKNYTVQEVSAPDGYVTDTNQTYTVKITETVCNQHNGDLILLDNGNTIPTHVTAVFEIADPDNNKQTFTIDLRDYYDGYNLSRRELTINDEEKVCLNIEDGAIVSVEDGSKQSGDNKLFTVSKLEDGNVSCDVETVLKYADVPEKDENGNIKYYTIDVLVGEPDTVDIGQLAWSNNKESVFNLDELTLYYYDGEYKGHYETFSGFTNATFQEWWTPINLPESLITEKLEKVMGFKAKFSGTSENNEEFRFMVQNRAQPDASDDEKKILYTNIKNDNLEITYGIIPEIPVIESPTETTNETEQPTEENIESGEFTIEQPTENDEPVVQTDAAADLTPEQTTEIAPVVYADDSPAESTFTVTSSITQVTATSMVTSSWTVTKKVQHTTQVTVPYYQTVDYDLSAETGVINGKNYKNEPGMYMLMPMPENVPKFTNKRGLLFEKVDGEGNRLTGATIKVYDGNTDVSEQVGFDWGGNASSFTIDMEKLDKGTIYNFTETTPPAEYETADPIYFKRNDDDTISYGNSINSLDKTIDINSDEIKSIQMTDIKITGAEFKMSKVDDETKNFLNGSRFILYSGTSGDKKDGVRVYPKNAPTDGEDGFTIEHGENGIFNLKDVFKNYADNVNSDFVKNGYLLPGNYFLVETKSPNGYDGTGSEFRFKVVKDKTTGEYQIKAINGTAELPMNIKWEAGKDNHQLYADIPDIGVLNGGSCKLENVVEYEIKLKEQGNMDIYTTLNEAKPSNITEYNFKSDTPTDLNKFEVQRWDADLKIAEITIKTTDAIYKYVAGGSGGSTGGGDSGSEITGAFEGQNENNPTLTIGYDILAAAKLNPDEPFISWNNAQINGGQIHIKLTGNSADFSANMIKDGIDTSKSQYTFNDILAWANKSADEIAAVRFMIWGGNFGDWTAMSPIAAANLTRKNVAVLANATPAGVTISETQIVIDRLEFTGLSDADVYISFTVNTPSNQINWGNGSIKINNDQKNNTSIGGFSGNFNSEVVNYSIKVSEIKNLAKEGDKFEFVLWNASTFSNVSFGSSGGNTPQTTQSTEQTHSTQTTETAPDTSEQSSSSTTTTTTTTTITTSATTETTTTEPVLTATVNEHGVLVVPNKKTGDKISITGKKEWAGDDKYDFTSLRPNEITLKLTRKKLDGENYVDDADFNALGTNSQKVTAEMGWQYSWTELDSKDENDKPYRYYLDEEGLSAQYNYYEKVASSSFLTGSGILTVTNKLKTITIKAQKTWLYGANDSIKPYLPESLDVKLQYAPPNSENWHDVEVNGNPFIITLTGEQMKGGNSQIWYKEIDSLPENYWYKIVEVNVPVSWTSGPPTIARENGGITAITNTLKTGDFEISKNWENDNENDRPDSINVDLYRTIIKPDDQSIEKSPETVTQYNDYARLLQYSLYFYDANMCGSDVNTASAYTWRGNCHIKDTVIGGYHDAGDHAMFGITQGFTASTLAWGYYEFQEAYDNLGQTEHLQTVLKRFCDFFVASTKLQSDEVTDFLYQKGLPETDHKYWGAPENQGISDRGKEFWTAADQPNGINGASNIAAEYAASLAAYTLCFPNDVKNNAYLKYAQALYKFATEHRNKIEVWEPKANGDKGEIYVDEDDNDDIAWAAAWLYLATKDNSYKNACKEKLGSCDIKKIGYHWGDVNLGAATLYASHIENDDVIKDKVLDYLNTYCASDGTDYVILDPWGSARHNALTQQVALSAYNNGLIEADYPQWSKLQMNFILGDNHVENNGKFSTCFVTGFADNSVKNTHHRAASGYQGYGGTDGYNDSNPKYHDTKGKVLVGALSGGVDNVNNDNTDKTTDYKQNEVTLDYNSGLVGAAAGLYYFYNTGNIIPQSDFGKENTDLSGLKSTYTFAPETNKVIVRANAKKVDEQQLTIDSSDDTKFVPIVLNLGDEKKLTYMEDFTVSVSENTDVVEITDNVIKAKKNGTAKLNITADGAIKELSVTVNLNAIPHDVEGMEWVETLKITKPSTDEWKMFKTGLPVYDKYGRRYYYYIKEKGDTNGKVGSYYPTAYVDGMPLKEDNNNISFTNTKADNNGITMPSTGGGGNRSYYIFGMAITCAAGAFMFLRRKRASK